jgi:RNA methyltransferase, TrmH family
MDEITSLQNQRIKEAAKLRERRERRKQRRILIDGVREIRRAIGAAVEIIEIFVCEPLCRTSDCRELLKELESLPLQQSRVTPAVFEKLAFGDRAEGVIAVAKTPDRTLNDLKLPTNPLVAVLEGVEKPGNIGAVLRSADAAGVSALIVAEGGTDLFNPNAIRASLGAIFSVPVCSAPSADVRDWLVDQRLTIFAARVDAEKVYTSVDLARPAAIVLGSEAAGLSETWNAGGVTPIRLPMHGRVDSLNVSAAAAVIFYEARRQREKIEIS